MPHPGEDDLALLALGEQLPGVADHVAACPGCAVELLALTSTVRTARGADVGALPPPPPAVWDRVVAELGLDAAPDRVLVPRGADRRRAARGVRRRLAVAAAAAAAVAAVAVGVVVLRPAEPATPRPPAAPLLALGGSSGTGEAALVPGPDGRVLEVVTRGLAPPEGFYEVWLLAPDDGRILALGTLDEGGRARLSVPPGVDLADYDVVDVSAEPDDGDPAHSADSVLRGDLPA